MMATIRGAVARLPRGGQVHARVGASLGREVRPEIQALRGAAVLLVLAYHFWPATLRGYVGVDVFFAISGYLITAHLLREVDATGRVSLPAFWARRARRILPASLVVLLACSVATIAFVARLQWEPSFEEIRASTLYVENWQLAYAAVDYLAADDATTPVRHFWSLSAEEQFYIAWPVLILAGAFAGRRAIAVVLAAVTVLSLAWSVHATATDPAAAYFVTPARPWEFGAGGLLALAVPAASAPGRARIALSWAGLAAIAAAAVAYSPATPFPGVAALLPVLGTIAVMAAAAPTPPLRLRPVQFLGDVSYSVYLWHWPLLVFAPILLDRAMTTPEKLTVLAPRSCSAGSRRSRSRTRCGAGRSSPGAGRPGRSRPPAPQRRSCSRSERPARATWAIRSRRRARTRCGSSRAGRRASAPPRAIPGGDATTGSSGGRSSPRRSRPATRPTRRARASSGPAS
jgi:peptidoglycan/LPS O-acetylase OafA/YrhL